MEIEAIIWTGENILGDPKILAYKFPLNDSDLYIQSCI